MKHVLSFVYYVSGFCNAQNLLSGLANLTMTSATSGQNNPTAQIAIYSFLGIIISIVILCCLCAFCKALNSVS